MVGCQSPRSNQVLAVQEFQCVLSSSFHWERTAKGTNNVTPGINVTSGPSFFILTLFSELIWKTRAQKCVYSRRKKKSPILASVSVSQVLFMLQSWFYLMRHNVIINLSNSHSLHQKVDLAFYCVCSFHFCGWLFSYTSKQSAVVLLFSRCTSLGTSSACEYHAQGNFCTVLYLKKTPKTQQQPETFFPIYSLIYPAENTKYKFPLVTKPFQYQLCKKHGLLFATI